MGRIIPAFCGRRISGRVVALSLCVSAGLLWALCELMLLKIHAKVAEQQLDYTLALQREEADEQQIANLERQLGEERGKRAQNTGPGNKDALIQALTQEVKVLKSQNIQLQEALRRGATAARVASTAAQDASPLARSPDTGSASYSEPTSLAPRIFEGGQTPILAQRGLTGSHLTEDLLRAYAAADAVGVAVIVCKRPQYLKRAMESILKADRDATQFPIVISQDAHDETMASMIKLRYVDEGIAHTIQHDHDPNAPSIAKKFGKGRANLGYVRIAQHYGFVMRSMFDDFKFRQAVFLEEDMAISPDFFSYFEAMLPLLRGDQTLFCVSAWNDNGYRSLVNDSGQAWRTDFFPGLGWMMTRNMWDEVRDHWPEGFWDEFMRRPDVRKDRHCIRPEISRSSTFGAEGTSQGQFFKQHLSKILLSDVPLNWKQLDLAYLSSETAFDKYLVAQLQAATETTVNTIDGETVQGRTLRILYDDKKDYKVRVAKRFGLMPDEKEGIRRMSYHGVIPFHWRGNRVYLYTADWPLSDAFVA